MENPVPIFLLGFKYMRHFCFPNLTLLIGVGRKNVQTLELSEIVFEVNYSLFVQYKIITIFLMRKSQNVP